MLAPLRRLPGIAIQALPRALPERLPRMDIAGFVGFAASGPIDRPVVVEDAARFAELFGEDLELIPGGTDRAPLYAHLAPSVRAFFANGGRRCWVVRVAGRAPQLQRFPVPGLVAIDRDGTVRPAVARARSPGSWADRLAVETTLRPRRIAGAGLEARAGQKVLTWPLRHGEPPAPGDLLRLRFQSGGRERLAFLPITAAPAQEGPRFALPFELEDALWLSEPAALEAPGQVIVPAADGSLLEVAATALTGGAFRVAGVPQAAVQPGLALPVRLADDRAAIIIVGRTAPEPDPAGGGPQALNVTPDALWLLDEVPPAAPDVLLDVVRLRFDLTVREQEARRWRIAGLGLAPGDPRFWAALPDDDRLFPPPDALQPSLGTDEPGALARAAARPRFPLAGPEAGGGLRFFLPLGMSTTPDAGARATALGDVDPGSRLERDGLDGFGPDLFVDGELKGQTFHDLAARALDKRYLRRDPEPLRGVHALYFLDEVTLLAAPDAVHGGWTKQEEIPGAPGHLVAPVLAPVDGTSGRARWDGAGPDGVTYELEQALDPAFERVQRRYRTADPEVALEAPDCPADLWFRVRARTERDQSPWSNTERARLPGREFGDCVRAALLAAPELMVPDDAGRGARFRVAWSPIEGADRYRLEQSGEPAFLDALLLALVDEPGLDILHGVDDDTYYRVRAERLDPAGEIAEVGPWSATGVALPAPVPQLRLVRAEREASLEVHLAMLRMAAARADMLAVLSFESGTGLPRALAYRQALAEALGVDEEAALGYGALYLPWLRQRDRTGATRLVPPDGALVGRTAERARLRGAWIAPANQPLADAIALESVLDRSDWAVLYALQVNLLQAAPAGFMALSADTLSSDPSRRPISVCRLVALLRRLCLREGSRLVFEPNSPSLRRRTRLLFDGIMADLFARGAFAGRRPDEGYRVRVSDEARDVDAGRLIVELRIAPSQPLEFLTVRLIENRETGTLRVEEAG